jgi:hypothetical protein
MARRKTALQRRRRLISAVLFIALVAAAIYGTYYHPPAEVKVEVVVRALRFLYHPAPEGPNPGKEAPLLAGVSFDALSVRSFDTISAQVGILSVRDSADQPWKMVQAAPVMIRSKDTFTKAIFSGGTIKRWRFKQLPTVMLEFTNRQPVLHALIEGQDIELFFDAGDSIEFQCQLCLIEGVDGEASSRPRQMRLSELNQVPPKASSHSTMTLDAIPGPGGFGAQRFSMSRPWFCGGPGPEHESSVVSGNVTFTQTGRVQQVVGQSSANRPGGVLRLIPDNTFAVTALGVVDLKDGKALDLQFDRPARRAELASNCESSGSTFQPSLSEVLAHTWFVATPYTAFLLLLGWLSVYDQVGGVWKRFRGKENGK